MRILLLLAVVATALFFWWSKSPTITAANSDISFNYVVRHTGDASATTTLPMLIALHGNGDLPEHFFSSALNELVQPARVILLRGPLVLASGGAWPMQEQQLRTYGGAVASVAEQLIEKYPTSGKPVLFGFSGGAVMAYYLALEDATQYAAIIPVSGRLPQDMLQQSLPLSGQATEVYAFHGSQDRVITFSSGRKTAELLASLGIPVVFNPFDGGHHGVFTTEKRRITRQIEASLRSTIR